MTATKKITLGGQTTQQVTFTTTQDAAGSYAVSVNGLSGTFTVTAPGSVPAPTPTPTPMPTPTLTPTPTPVPATATTQVNWGLIGSIIIASIIIIGLISWTIAKRRAVR